MSFTRRIIAATTGLALALAAACGSDSPTEPNATPVIGVSATSSAPTTATVTFTSKAGDNSYNIERAEGTTGTFSQVGNVAAPSTPGSVTFNDSNLQASTLYRYRVITVVGSVTSTPSSEALVTTPALGPKTADITGDITADRTLRADTVYTLKGFIHVTNGAKLTIEPGTKIQGDFNTLGSSLFIMRGAQIDAQGTAAAPIVFTSSRAAGSRQPGDWGGLIIVGNAPSARTGDVFIEGSGVDGTDIVGGKNYYVKYSGGTTMTDNSGTLKYVRVEFAGFAPATDQGRNVFTFAAVGSGTRVSYTQALGGLDDSYEFFGGGLDGDHMVAYETGDDMFDMSEGFQGRLQFLIGFNSAQLTQRTGAGSLATDLEGIENDGCQGSGCDNGFNQQPFTIPLIANFTLVGCGAQQCVGPSGGFGMMLRRGTGGYYVNGVLSRFPAGGISLRDSSTYLRGGNAAVPDLATTDIAVRNVYFSELGGPMFQAGTGQYSFDAAGNNLIAGTVTGTGLFTAIPATLQTPAGVSSFDWTPAASSPIATGGMDTFSGKIATKAGTFVTGTAYLGAADPAGTNKWWTGWTVYARN